MWVKKAAYHGNADAKWHLGNMYLKGEGTSVDFYFATQWLAEVAMTTHKKQFNDLLKEDNEGTYSQYLMGLRKYYVDKDYASALDYFKKVEKAKNVEGTTMLGVCYANKEYIKRNLSYMTGNGVEQNATKAVLLYIDTEAQNHLAPQSAKNLAECYRQRLSVLSDLQNADKRMEQPGKQKVNNNLINLLKLLEKLSLGA